MAAEVAERVIISIEAQTAAAQAAVNNFGNSVTRSMSNVERAATEAETRVRTSVSRMGQEVTHQTGQMQFATRDLGFQLSDIGVQLAGGTSPFVIIAQQGPATISALQMITASGAALGTVLRGLALPGILALASALYGIISAHKGASDASRDHAKAVDELAEAISRLNGQAAINDHATRQGIIDDANRARTRRDQARATLEQANAELVLARARLKFSSELALRESQGDVGGGAGIQVQFDAKAIDAQIKAIGELKSKITDANRGILVAAGKLGLRDIAAQTDKATAATQRYDDAIDRLRRQLESGKITRTAFEQQALAATKARDAALETAKAVEHHGAAVKKAKVEIIDYSVGLQKTTSDVWDFIEALNAAEKIGDKHFDALVGTDYKQAYKDATSGNPLHDASQADTQASDAAKRHAEDQVRDVADLYYELFDGGTARVWDNFKRQGLRAIAEIAARWTIANLFNKGAGGSKDIATIAGSVLQSFSGRASGGYMAPGSIARVNEHAGGVELLRMGPQGGEVIPLGATRAAVPQGGTTIIHAPQFNLRGAVVTRELYADMERISDQSATRAATVGYQKSLRDAPAAVQRARRFGS